MREPGQRTAGTYQFMTAVDEEAFQRAFDTEEFGCAWITTNASERIGHQNLVEAIAAGRGEALLQLVDAGEFVGPVVQYWMGRHHDGNPDHLRAGGFRFKWFPGDEDPSVADRFEVMTKAAFRAMRSITTGGVVRHDGTVYRTLRIGHDARRWYLERPWPHRQLVNWATFHTYRLGVEPARGGPGWI